VDQKDRTSRVRKDVWHRKSYDWWLDNGGRPATYRENFCRYFWIVMFRAPLRRFFMFIKSLYTRNPTKVKRLVKWVTVPIWLPFVLIFFGARKVCRRYDKQLRRFGGWLINPRRYGRTPPILLIVIGVTVVMMGLALFHDPIETLIVIGVMLGLLMFMVGLFFGLGKLSDRHDERESSRKDTPSGLKKARTKVFDTVKLTKTYVKTKKDGSRICPFIEFE
jgi:hypothetical protein